MGLFDRIKKAVTNVVRVAFAPITVPVEVAVNVVTGENPIAPVAEVARAAAEVVETTASVAVIPSQLAIDLSSSAGPAGKILGEILVGDKIASIELAERGADAFAAIFEGRNPLETLAIPLATAIAAAAAEFDRISQPVPEQVRNQLATFFPGEILSKAKYAIGSIGINLPEIINGTQKFMGTHEHAVTVEHIIVFSAEPPSDRNGLLWWAHELQHVSQYMDWGVNKFAYKYITDWEGVEREAEEKAAII